MVCFTIVQQTRKLPFTTITNPSLQQLPLGVYKASSHQPSSSVQSDHSAVQLVKPVRTDQSVWSVRFRKLDLNHSVRNWSSSKSEISEKESIQKVKVKHQKWGEIKTALSKCFYLFRVNRAVWLISNVNRKQQPNRCLVQIELKFNKRSLTTELVIRSRIPN